MLPNKVTQKMELKIKGFFVARQTEIKPVRFIITAKIITETRAVADEENYKCFQSNMDSCGERFPLMSMQTVCFLGLLRGFPFSKSESAFRRRQV